MSVTKVFWEDPYLTQLPAKLTSVQANKVTVDQTIAYAFSGGQESDYGTINQYPILRADKEGQQIIYSLAESPELNVGEAVLITIDWQRRYKLMRLHFAAEIILELVNQQYDHPVKVGAHIAADKARVDFEWDGNISQIFPWLEREAGCIIVQNLPITSAFSDRENEIRYWQIDNFARVSCGGTHLKTTGEIGKIALKRNNIGKGKERIEITLVADMA